MSVFAGLVFLRLLRTIHALQNSETQATYRATHDGLTHLPNRVAFLEQLDRHLTDSVSGGGSVNVLLIGFDFFRKINDTWGHAAGDEFLVQITARLRSALDPEDLLSRAGGDQFAVRVDTFTEDAIEAVVGRLQDAFQAPLEISSERMSHLTITIGVARSPHDGGKTAENLLRDADQAYTQAKAAGRGTVATHDDQMSTRILRRHRLAEELDGALDRGEIHVVYQPIRTGSDFGELSGWEALARWQHPKLGTISPVEFIPIAEDTGLILPIGEFVLRTACTQLAIWQHNFSSPGLHMSVNVSSVQLMRDELANKVSKILGETEITNTSLWLEITESVLLDHTTDAVAELNTLTELGVKLCLDDFGTGFSSLSYLKAFHIDFLKIDQSFIMQLVNDPRDQSLAKAMIEIAAALNMEGVVAEGIETPEQAAVLTKLGCSHVQGYLYGRPEPANQAAISLASIVTSQTKPASPPPVPTPRTSHPTASSKSE